MDVRERENDSDVRPPCVCVCVCVRSFLLGDVIGVDDGRGAEQLLEFLRFEGLRETLQSDQQQLQLLWSSEG